MAEEPKDEVEEMMSDDDLDNVEGGAIEDGLLGRTPFGFGGNGGNGGNGGAGTNRC